MAASIADAGLRWMVGRWQAGRCYKNRFGCYGVDSCLRSSIVRYRPILLERKTRQAAKAAVSWPFDAIKRQNRSRLFHAARKGKRAGEAHGQCGEGVEMLACGGIQGGNLQLDGPKFEEKTMLKRSSTNKPLWGAWMKCCIAGPDPSLDPEACCHGPQQERPHG